MITIKIPTMNEFWLWLCRFSYKRIAGPTRKPPVGIPGMRDPNSPCEAFTPRQKYNDDWSDCQTDGHYLCRECALIRQDIYQETNQ
jgi:hypothetical protein